MKLGLRRGKGSSCRHGHAIGLDFGATSVRVVVLSLKERDGARQIVIEKIGGAPLAPGTVVDGVVEDPAALTAALKQLWREQKIGCRSVVLGLANAQIQVRELQVPDLDPARRAQALPFQAREVVALPIEQVVLDFAPLGGPDEETGLVNGLLVATPRDLVVSAVGAVEAAGLRVARVDLASFAVLRAVAQGGLTTEAVIDLGAHLTTVVVHRDGVPAMVRTLPRGGDEITTRLAARLKVEREEAETAKRVDGLSATTPASEALEELVRPLLNDIRTSLNYFRSTGAGGSIEHVSLTGRAALMPGLADAIARQVGAPTTVETPERLLETSSAIDPNATDPAWTSALSVGLAIGAAA